MVEVEELPHQTPDGRWCAEVQPAVEVGTEWGMKRKAAVA
jgi:hypothetical protein